MKIIYKEYIMIVILVAILLAIIIGNDARKRGYAYWRLWAIFTFLLAILAIPIYIIKVFIVDKKQRIKYAPVSAVHVESKNLVNAQNNFCTSCGNKLDPLDKFCRSCGKKI